MHACVCALITFLFRFPFCCINQHNLTSNLSSCCMSCLSVYQNLMMIWYSVLQHRTQYCVHLCAKLVWPRSNTCRYCRSRYNRGWFWLFLRGWRSRSNPELRALKPIMGSKSVDKVLVPVCLVGRKVMLLSEIILQQTIPALL